MQKARPRTHKLSLKPYRTNKVSYLFCKVAVPWALIRPGFTEELATSEYVPDWIAGVSIGAINAALIAGNVPERRVERLREFWHRVSSGMLLPEPITPPNRTAFKWFSSRLCRYLASMAFIKCGRFSILLHHPDTRPHWAFMTPHRCAKTLLELIDFDLINRKPVRFKRRRGRCFNRKLGLF